MAPNLLFLYTDEQRFDTMACYGNKTIDMPNLNRLADTSTVFEQAYCTQPVCTPSRASLLTGLTPHTAQMTTNNLMLPHDVACLPEMLPRDYHCAHIGKWHLGDEIFAQHGFDTWTASEDTYHAFYSPERDQNARSAYYHYLISQGIQPRPRGDVPPEIADRFFRDQMAKLPEEHSRPAFLARETVKFLRENHKQPFCCYVNFLEPHMPFYGCRDDQYDPDKVTLPPNFMHELDASAPQRARRAAQKYRESGFEIDPKLDTEAAWRKLIARYWGLCSLVDTHVGHILQEMETLGLMDNTVIVFTSDHGDMMGSHNLLGKGYMFEESSRIPLLMRMPGQRQQRRIKGPSSQIDVVPTLLKAMGAEVPDHLEGKERTAWVENGADQTEDVFIEWHGKGVGRQPQSLMAKDSPEAGKKPVDPVSGECIRTVVTPEGWKLSVSSIGDHELYDLNADPYETQNLVTQPGQAGRVSDLLDRIRRWQERTGDDMQQIPSRLELTASSQA